MNISSVNHSIDKLSSDIKLKRADIKDKQALLDERVGVLYKTGASGYLGILLGAKDISDLLQKAIYLQRIVSMDNQLISTLNSDKSGLEQDRKDSFSKRKSFLL